MSLASAAKVGAFTTVDQATLKAPRNPYEDRVLLRLAEVLPAAVKVRIVADRGFGDQKR